MSKGLQISACLTVATGVLLLGLGTAVAKPRLSEILFNPPGADEPNEYLELRGAPNEILPAGTYCLSLEGDAAGNPGVIENVFDLSGRALGGNGFLVLLQTTNAYLASSNATVLVNTNGLGWGSGATSSLGHRGRLDRTDLKNPSVTFLLLQTTNAPVPGQDVDANNDGVIDAPFDTQWRVIDSVGILDADGPGDIAYGLINFRRDTAPGSGAQAANTVVAVGFTPRYVGRSGNTTGWAPADWVAANTLTGAPPVWTLGANTVPAGFAGQALNPLGTPNFGAPEQPGVVAIAPADGLSLLEGTTNAVYWLGLNTAPAGPVKIEITAPPPLLASCDGGANFSNTLTVAFTNTGHCAVRLKALADDVVDWSPRRATVFHRIVESFDPAYAGAVALMPSIRVAVIENGTPVLNELKANPPGTNDGPFEFVEILGPPGARLTNAYFVALEGNRDRNPGLASYLRDLTANRFGVSGLLVIAASNAPYPLPLSATLVADARFGQPEGALGNGSLSFLLVASPAPLTAGTDFDPADDGTLQLPAGARILDAVGWTDGSANALVYGGVKLKQDSGKPDAAARFPGNQTPLSAAAWFNGELTGPDGASLTFDETRVSRDFPSGTPLSPGALNHTAPVISPLPSLCGAIGDPTNPRASFTVGDAESPASQLVVTATSANPAVVPDTNLFLTINASGQGVLALTPVGVGYSRITLTVSDGALTGRATFQYAASAAARPETRYHTAVSDASTAFALDADWMFVGDDENQTIRLYRRDASGAPVAGFDFTGDLALTDLYADGRPREADIEASTRAGDRIYWLGSGSNSELGEVYPNRSRVFATDLSGAGTNAVLTYVGRYKHLKQDILDWDASNGHGKGSNYYGLTASAAAGISPKAEDGSGFNIEGLAFAPGSTNVAYVALRAPYVPPATRAKALIVVVTNFAAVSIGGGAAGAARFGPPIELNLLRRGIRSLEAAANGVLIVAGPAGKAGGPPPNDFRLFTWSGGPDDQPQERAADLSGLNPEGIVELPPGPWTAAAQVQLVSDNGTTDFYGDAVEAKRLPDPAFKKFRSDWVALGAAVESRPLLHSAGAEGGRLVLSWYALEGRTYRVQCSPDLRATAWTGLAGDIAATNGVAVASVPIPAEPQRYFRLARAP